MRLSPDQLAGVVDLFGGLTREELLDAVEDLAAKTGEPFDRTATAERVTAAEHDYYLVAVDEEDRTLLAPGPAALPTLPEYGEDLPHILAIEPRDLDRADIADAVEQRLRGEAARAVDAGDRERAAALLDVCYEFDAWAGADTAAIRDRLDALSGEGG